MRSDNELLKTCLPIVNFELWLEQRRAALHDRACRRAERNRRKTAKTLEQRGLL